MDRKILPGCFLGLIAIAFVSFSPQSVAQFDSVRVAYGSAFTPDVEADDLRLAARWSVKDFEKRGGGWQRSLMVEAVYTHWNSTISSSANKSGRGADDIYGFFITPVLRFEDTQSASVNPYLELGLGVGTISDDEIRRKERIEPLHKSSHFQFELKVGAGFIFGE